MLMRQVLYKSHEEDWLLPPKWVSVAPTSVHCTAALQQATYKLSVLWKGAVSVRFGLNATGERTERSSCTARGLRGTFCVPASSRTASDPAVATASQRVEYARKLKRGGSCACLRRRECLTRSGLSRVNVTIYVLPFTFSG